MEDPKVQAIDKRIRGLQGILMDWDAYADKVRDVGRLEEATQLVPVFEREKGYHRIPALQGYRQLVKAFQLLDEDLTEAQRREFDYVLETLSGLERDYQFSGRSHPGTQQAKQYAEMKMAELEDKGEIYLLSGHKEHFNITKIRKTMQGYTYTLYDAGHESEIVGQENGRAIINAVQEFRIRPDADIKNLICNDVMKRGVDDAGADYQNYKNRIQNALLPGPIRAIQDYAQRRGNCTTRGQRILIGDIIQNPDTCERLYDFVTDLEGVGGDNIKEAFANKIHQLSAQRRAIREGREDISAMNGNLFLKVRNPDNFENVQIGTDDGNWLSVYRTKPDCFSIAELKEIQKKARQDGLSASLRESVSQPGWFYLYVRPELQEHFARSIIQDHQAESVPLRQVHDLLQGDDCFEIAQRGKQDLFRTRPGLLTPSQAQSLAAAVSRHGHGCAAYARESTSSPGLWYMGINFDIKQDSGGHFPALVMESIRREMGERSASRYIPKETLRSDFSQAARKWGQALFAMLPSFLRPDSKNGPQAPGSY